MISHSAQQQQPSKQLIESSVQKPTCVRIKLNGQMTCVVSESNPQSGVVMPAQSTLLLAYCWCSIACTTSARTTTHHVRQWGHELRMGKGPRGGVSYGTVLAFLCLPYKLTQNAPGGPRFCPQGKPFAAKAKFTQTQPVCAVNM